MNDATEDIDLRTRVLEFFAETPKSGPGEVSMTTNFDKEDYHEFFRQLAESIVWAEVSYSRSGTLAREELLSTFSFVSYHRRNMRSIAQNNIRLMQDPDIVLSSGRDYTPEDIAHHIARFLGWPVQDGKITDPEIAQKFEKHLPHLVGYLESRYSRHEGANYSRDIRTGLVRMVCEMGQYWYSARQGVVMSDKAGNA